MAIKTDNQLVLKIEKVIREHKMFKEALQNIAKGTPVAKEYAATTIKRARAIK